MNTFESHDGLKIRFETYVHWHEDCRGTVVLLGGRSEFIEKYRETVDALLARKLNVYMFDWRGQGLSDRMLPNRYKGYVASYGDYLQDLTNFMERYVPRPKDTPVILLAHSMGGHIALRYLHDTPGRVDKAVLTSPLIDIAGPTLLTQTIKMLVKIAAKSGFKTKYATKANDFDPLKKHFKGNRLTRDPHRFNKMIQMITHNPNVAIGGVTFGWLNATFDSIQHLNEEGYLEQISTPLLIISAGADEIVSVGAQKKACKRIPDCHWVMIPDALHELLIETDTALDKFWKIFDEFIFGSSPGG